MHSYTVEVKRYVQWYKCVSIGASWSMKLWHMLLYELIHSDMMMSFHTLWHTHSPEVATVWGSFQWILQQWIHKWTKKNNRSNNLLFGFDLSIQHRRRLTDLHANNDVHKYIDLVMNCVMRWKWFYSANPWHLTDLW